MAYVVDTIHFPRAMSGGAALSCNKQHEEYAAEKARVSALAAQLGPVAEQCHALHGAYDSAVAAHEAAQAEKAQCQSLFATYAAALSAKQQCDAQKTAHQAAVDSYTKAKATHAAAVEKNAAVNAAKKKDFETRTAQVRQENIAIGQRNSAGAAKYASDYTAWKKQYDAHYSYRQAVSGEASGLHQAWIAKTPQSVRDQYQFNHVTGRCGVSMRCQTTAWRKGQANKCTVVKGLGATQKVADACMVYHYYPICPEKCPGVYAADPGPAPKTFVPSGPLPYPAEPAYTGVVSLSDFLKQMGIPVPGQGPTCNPPTPTKPGCNPDAQLPGVPSKPTCTPPNIPAMPVAPTCKPTMTSQVGTMWLLLAAGAGGLYWYSKKK